MAKNILRLSDNRYKVLSDMYQYLTQRKGLTPQAASAILGNVMQESTFDHSSVSNKGARGVYQLLGDKWNRYNKFLSTGWKDGPLSQSEWVINELFDGIDYYYKDYDRYKQEQKDNWRTRTADGKGWYPVPNDSIRFMQIFYPKEKTGTLPPRREEVVDAINNSTDIPKITQLFMDYWEHPGEDEKLLDQRINYSNTIYNHFNSKLKLGGQINYLKFFK